MVSMRIPKESSDLLILNALTLPMKPIRQYIGLRGIIFLKSLIFFFHFHNSLSFSKVFMDLANILLSIIKLNNFSWHFSVINFFPHRWNGFFPPSIHGFDSRRSSKCLCRLYVLYILTAHSPKSGLLKINYFITPIYFRPVASQF